VVSVLGLPREPITLARIDRRTRIFDNFTPRLNAALQQDFDIELSLEVLSVTIQNLTFFSGLST